MESPKDVNSLIDHFADGSPYTLNYVDERTAARSGVAGTWVSTSLEAVKPMSSCLAQGSQRVHFGRAPRWKVAG